MRIFYLIFFLIFFESCSFDNKSGIWKDINKAQDKDSIFEDFEKLSTSADYFKEIIKIKEDYKFSLSNPIQNSEWVDIYYNNSNSFENFKYNNQNNLILKSKKITKYKPGSHLLFENSNIITSDQKGNIIVFSITENKIISKFNFYKNRFKNIKKKINFILENGIVYVSDNLGYLYAIDYNKTKVLWAKNYKIPFRSNLKLNNELLIAANQNNTLFFFNKQNGEIVKKIPTEETLIKNEFINNLSINRNYLFFLNTYGSLYSINLTSKRVEWFLNLNQSLDLNSRNLFTSKEIINHNGKLIVSSNQYFYVLDETNGRLIVKKNFVPKIKPVINNDKIFLITKNNLLISMNLNNGTIIYSYDINQKISEYLKIKKKKVSLKNIIIANSQLFLFLENNFLLLFNVSGNISEIRKLPSTTNTNPIFVDRSILYLDKKNRILMID